MAKLKLKVAKSGRVNPQTEAKGFAARVITNGTAGYEDIVAEASHNTTLHKAEAKVALELCMESVAEMLKQGYIVDLGPVGKLYPSCTSGWVEKAEDLQLSSVPRRSTIVQPTRWQLPSRVQPCNRQRRQKKRKKKLAVALAQVAALRLRAVNSKGKSLTRQTA